MQKKLRKWAILALLLVLFISHTVAANAVTGEPDYTVYTYHALIDALDSAEAGDVIGIMDTIVVATPQEIVFSKGDQGARVTLKRMSSNAQIIFRDTGFGGGSVVEKIRFNGNSTLVGGSSAFVRVEGKASFDRCEFIKCSNRNSSGGAMIVPNGGEVYLSNCSFSGNVASTGAQIWSAGTVELSYCILSGGEAIHQGGGIYNYGGTLTITESEISDGRAKSGAGIYSMGSVEINNSLIWNNTASIQGNDILNAGTLTDNTTDEEYIRWLDSYDLYYIGWEDDRTTESLEECLKLVYSYDKPTSTPESTPEPVVPDPTPTPDPDDGGESGGSEGDDPTNKPVDPEPTDPPVTPEPTNPDEGENDPTVTPTPTEPSKPSEGDNSGDKGNTSDNSGAGSNTGENGSSEKPTEPPTGDNEQVPPSTDNSNTKPEGKDPDPTSTPEDNKPEPSPSTPDNTDQGGSGGNDKPTGDNSSNKPSSGGNTATDNNQSSNNSSHSTVNNTSSKSDSIKTENSNNTSTVNNYYTQNSPQKEEVITAQSIPAPVRDTPIAANVPESKSSEVSPTGQVSAHTDTGQTTQQNIKIDAKGVDLIYEYTADGVSISISSERTTESPSEALSISQLSNPTEPPETPQTAQNSPNWVEIITMILLVVLVLSDLRDRFKKTT